MCNLAAVRGSGQAFFVLDSRVIIHLLFLLANSPARLVAPAILAGVFVYGHISMQSVYKVAYPDLRVSPLKSALVDKFRVLPGFSRNSSSVNSLFPALAESPRASSLESALTKKGVGVVCSP